MTDFDMSKLLGNDPRLTPTLSPSTMVYMSPEALGELPAYTRKLDIFSSGVLHVQLITRKFPDPGPRMKTVQVGEDSRFAVSQVHVEVAEVERRRSHIDLIDPAHPLLKIALDCLKDKEGQRPTAEQLCSRLAVLKESPRYRDSLQPAQQAAENLGVAAEAQAEPQRELLQQNQELRQQLEEGRETLQAKEREADSLIRNMELQSHTQERQAQDREAEIRRKNEQIHQMGEQLRQTSEQLQERNVQIQRKEAQIQQIGGENRELRQQLEEGRETLQAKEREEDSLIRNMELQSHTQERQAQDREAEIRRKNEQIHQMGEQLRQTSEQLQERNVQIQRKEAQIQQMGEENRELRQQLEEGRETLQAKEREEDSLIRNMELQSHTQERQAQDREAEIRRKNEQIHQMGEQLRQTSEQLQGRNVQIQRKEAQIQQIGGENRELRQQLEEGKETLQAKEREVDSLTRNMEQLQLQSHTQERQGQDREAEIRRKNKQLQERIVQIQRLEAQIQQLHQTSRDSERLRATLQQSIEQKEKKTETCSVTLPETCSVGESAQVSVKVPQSVGTNVQAQLKSLADPSCVMLASVTPTNADTYTITFTPRVRGRHDVTVTVNGKEIAGSPFRVFVKIHPTQLGQPVRTITGLNHPWGIAINSKQQLVVTEIGGKKTTIMERDGKRVQTIKCEKFKGPRGVATGPDGAIYITDSDAQCLFKFDKEGKLLKTVQNNSKTPYSVKIVKNQLYVADYSNLVKIFDTDCNVVGTIQTKECSQPLDIAVGEDGGLYVVGSGGKIAVYRCAPNGEFIRHLNINPSLNLSEIRSICFDSSGHLFVVNNYILGTGVYVFQPSGEHVASLSLARSGGWPAGIAIDDDGFVYVCMYQTTESVTVF